VTVDFSRRATTPEWMDTHDVTPADFADCLRDLEVVNRLTRAVPPTLAFLQAATITWPRGRSIRVLDCGYGQGGMLRAVHRWALARGFHPVLTGVDLNPRSRIAAVLATPAGMAIDWRTGNIFDEPDDAHDFVISALFAHHLDDAGVARFVAWMERTAAAGWFVNDLHRHWLAWGGFWLLARLAGWHRFVRHDGPLSVRRAFVRREWQAVLGDCGISAARIRWHLPFRLCIARVK
jgi:SAM-dependent methyltransferase